MTFWIRWFSRAKEQRIIESGQWTEQQDDNIYWINPKISGNVKDWAIGESSDGEVIIHTDYYPGH